jgi:hypothetical protein
MMAHVNPRDVSIDMSLRLWSDQVPLKPLLKKLNLEVRHEHEMGQPIASAGRFAGRLADRHYMSLAHREGDDNDVGPWLENILAAIASNPALSDCLNSGVVTATAWFALFGDDERSPPRISSELIAAASRSHVKLFIENYTRFDSEGIPEKNWLNGSEHGAGTGS